MAVPIWGEAKDGEKVTVELQGQITSTTAKNGQWMVRLKPLLFGGPFDLKVTGDTPLVRKVWVGEVWIASGQSNMQWELQQTTNGPSDVSKANIPEIHLFQTPLISRGVPEKNVNSKWTECNPSTAAGFSAVAFYFGRDLLKTLKVPIGLIQTAWGGTPAQAWATRESLLANADLAHYIIDIDANIKSYPQRVEKYNTLLTDYNKAKAAGTAVGEAPKPPADMRESSWRPSGLYNGMIAPLVPYAFRGAIWYQGESNASDAYEYRTLFPEMIKSWRGSWKQGKFPFYFVQLAPFRSIAVEPQDSNWAELREAQFMTATTLANTGMAVITDYGNPVNIHPTDKDPVGARLALLALDKTYGRKVISSGPTYKSMSVKGNSVIIKFDNTNGGLMSRKVVLPGTPNNLKENKTDAFLTGWTIAGDDRKFVNAEAMIDGKTIVVSCPSVSKPAAVRYGWSDCPVVNLFNAAGLPASPFRTDSWRITTEPKKP